jgi:SAM-dependent methyltransferase
MSLVPDALLRCPRTGAALRREGGALVGPDTRYPIVDGVPVLVDDERSLFSAASVVGGPPRAQASRRQRLRERLSGNVVSRRNLAALGALLDARRAAGRGTQRVLVIGGGIAGYGMDALIDRAGVELVETDVYLGPRTAVVCDAHDLPFADGAFDAVVAQAVLEHVADPPRVVAELHRVLAADGLVYSEIPFMQQVHEGAYDFTRYTATGHRRLFRWFDELDRGAVSGPAEALAWSVRYLAVAVAGGSARRQRAAELTARGATLWLSLVDRLLLRRPAALDAASGTFFLGRARATPLPDGVIVAAHRGRNGTPDR